MQPLFVGGHPAVDFINTWMAPRGEPIECIGSGDAFIDWLAAAQMIDAPAAAQLRRKFGAAGLDGAAAEARALREWARGWLARWHAEPSGDHAKDLRRLNALLARANEQPQLRVTDTGLRLVRRPRLDTVQELVTLPAAALADLLVNEQPALLKHCAGAGCTLWFLDRTKAHRRLFCSADACGNRAKVAAFRERQRAG
jgi:predicted RNA-binding Zn ribbon-like protein